MRFIPQHIGQSKIFVHDTQASYFTHGPQFSLLQECRRDGRRLLVHVLSSRGHVKHVLDSHSNIEELSILVRLQVARTPAEFGRWYETFLIQSDSASLFCFPFRVKWPPISQPRTD